MAVRRRLREVDLAPSVVVPYLTPLLMTPRTKLGPDHPNTLTTRYWIADLRQQTGEES